MGSIVRYNQGKLQRNQPKEIQNVNLDGLSMPPAYSTVSDVFGNLKVVSQRQRKGKYLLPFIVSDGEQPMTPPGMWTHYRIDESEQRLGTVESILHELGMLIPGLTPTTIGFGGSTTSDHIAIPDSELLAEIKAYNPGHYESIRKFYDGIDQRGFIQKMQGRAALEILVDRRPYGTVRRGNKRNPLVRNPGFMFPVEVSGERLLAGKSRHLNSGDIITLGGPAQIGFVYQVR